MTRTQTLREAGYCLADGLKDILDADSLLRENDTGKEDGTWVDMRGAVIAAEDAIVYAHKLLTTTT